MDNMAPLNVENVTVDYVIVWRKDTFEDWAGPVVKGSHRLTSIGSGVDAKFTVGAIPMTNSVKRGGSTTSGGSCPKCPQTTVSTRTLRSRDQLVGCLIQVKVGDKVIKTEATSPSLLRKYEKEFSTTR